MSTFDAERYRTFHRRRGESYRWFKAVQSAAIDPTTGKGNPDVNDNRNRNNGRIYVEQTIPSHVTYTLSGRDKRVRAAAKALVSETVNEVYDFNQSPPALVKIGQMHISVMPDESYLSQHDRIVLSQRYLPTTYTLKRDKRTNGTLLDALKRPFVAAITGVFDSETTYIDGTDYQLTANSDSDAPFTTDSIEWLAGGNKPAVGDIFTIEHTYRPVYVFLGPTKLPRPDKNGILMPLRGDMDLEQVLS